MAPYHKYKPQPNDPKRPKTVRGAYIYNLVDCLHVCLLRGDLERARRAWAILVRCPDVDWSPLWLWGLHLLTAEIEREREGEGAESGASLPFSQGYTQKYSQGYSQGYTQSFSQGYSQSQARPGAQATRWIRSFLLTSKIEKKPGVLAELVLHLIKTGQYQDALSELEQYLPLYPYILSASLHTYAGLLTFYLAHPEGSRGGNASSSSAGTDAGRSDRNGDRDRDMRDMSVDSTATESTASVAPYASQQPPNPGMLREARAWFAKALGIDGNQLVAKGFIELIDAPSKRDQNQMSDDDWPAATHFSQAHGHSQGWGSRSDSNSLSAYRSHGDSDSDTDGDRNINGNGNANANANANSNLNRNENGIWRQSRSRTGSRSDTASPGPGGESESEDSVGGPVLREVYSSD